MGFDDPFYFSRVFKEIQGMSPRRYAAVRQAAARSEEERREENLLTEEEMKSNSIS